MKVVRGYKTELDPTSEQYVLLCQYAGASRFACNYGLARKQEAYKAGEKVPTAIDLQKELTTRKHTDLPWLAVPSKWVIQNALRDLDTAFRNFFRKVALKKVGKHQGKCGYPKYKSRKKGRGSFRLDCPIHVFEGAVQLPRIGTIKLKEKYYLPINANVLFATISEKAGRWYIAIQVEEEYAEPVPATGPAIGVDLGIKTLATLSDGRAIANPKALRSRLKALRRASRRHSRKQKGSKNREKACRRLACLHRRIAHIRQDSLHKATSQLVMRTKSPEERPGVIVLEDLNVAGMLKNRRLSRAIADVGLAEFRRQITYKAAQASIEVRIVSRWEPSSKTCSGCGWIDEDLTLADRTFVCEDCGLTLDRDYNAALNLAALA
jgi:putative transposase